MYFNLPLPLADWAMRSTRQSLPGQSVGWSSSICIFSMRIRTWRLHCGTGILCTARPTLILVYSSVRTHMASGNHWKIAPAKCISCSRSVAPLRWRQSVIWRLSRKIQGRHNCCEIVIASCAAFRTYAMWVTSQWRYSVPLGWLPLILVASRIPSVCWNWAMRDCRHRRSTRRWRPPGTRSLLCKWRESLPYSLSYSFSFLSATSKTSRRCWRSQCTMRIAIIVLSSWASWSFRCCASRAASSVGTRWRTRTSACVPRATRHRFS